MTGTPQGPLGEITAEHGYSLEPDVIPADYMTGYVNHERQSIQFRVGTDEAILEIALNVDDTLDLIGRLQGNVSELETVIERDDAAEELSDHVHDGLDDGSAYPVMQLLWSWVEDQGLWAEFATWANEVIDNGGLLNSPTDEVDLGQEPWASAEWTPNSPVEDDGRGWTNGGI